MRNTLELVTEFFDEAGITVDCFDSSHAGEVVDFDFRGNSYMINRIDKLAVEVYVVSTVEYIFDPHPVISSGVKKVAKSEQELLDYLETIFERSKNA